MSIGPCFLQADVPTTIGVGPVGTVPMETDKDSAPSTSSERKHYIDSTFLTPPREGVEMLSPLKDGMG